MHGRRTGDESNSGIMFHGGEGGGGGGGTYIHTVSKGL